MAKPNLLALFKSLKSRVKTKSLVSRILLHFSGLSSKISRLSIPGTQSKKSGCLFGVITLTL